MPVSQRHVMRDSVLRGISVMRKHIFPQVKLLLY